MGPTGSPETTRSSVREARLRGEVGADLPSGLVETRKQRQHESSRRRACQSASGVFVLWILPSEIPFFKGVSLRVKCLVNRRARFIRGHQAELLGYGSSRIF